MIFCKISMQEPNENSSQQYSSFYNMYSYIQLSNLVFSDLLQSASNQNIKDFIDVHNGQITDDDQRINSYLQAMMIRVNMYVGTKKSNVYTDIFDVLNGKGVNHRDTLEFFLNLQEFILIYALFEDNIKATIGNSEVKQIRLMDELKTYVTNRNVVERVEEIIDIKTNSALGSFEEIKIIWRYFTFLRNLYSHSAGIVTERILRDFNGIRKKVNNYSDKIVLLNLLTNDEEDVLNFNFEKDQLYIITDHQLNFFRSFVIYILETLEDTL